MAQDKMVVFKYAVAAIVVMAVIFGALQYKSNQEQQEALSMLAMTSGGGGGYVDPGTGQVVPQEPQTIVVESTCDLSSITVTVTPRDIYNPGTKVETPIMWRVLGKVDDGEIVYKDIPGTWTSTISTSSAGASITTVSADDYLEIVVGLNETSDDALAYGDIIYYHVLCEKSQEVSTFVYNDALATDLTDVYYDLYDQPNTAISGSSAGDTFDVAISAKGSFEEAFGNPFCDKGNLYILKYKANEVDTSNLKITSVEDGLGNTWSGTSIKSAAIPPGISATLSASGYSLAGWEGPKVLSGATVKIDYHLPADQTNPINTTGNAMTWYIYDVALYLDNNVNEVLEGWEDEAQAEIGAAAADSIAPSIAP